MPEVSAPIRSGGMEFDGTSFTVPEQGFYYVYGQLVISDTDTGDCGFTIDVTTVMPPLAFLSVTHPASADKDVTIFGSEVRRLEPGDEVVMSTLNCTYSFDADKAHFGIFQLKG